MEVKDQLRAKDLLGLILMLLADVCCLTPFQWFNKKSSDSISLHLFLLQRKSKIIYHCVLETFLTVL